MDTKIGSYYRATLDQGSTNSPKYSLSEKASLCGGATTNSVIGEVVDER
jgi:hypothetical protein